MSSSYNSYVHSTDGDRTGTVVNDCEYSEEETQPCTFMRAAMIGLHIIVKYIIVHKYNLEN